jgi:prepilin-type N-terminal cleavage/methylation domain-containing protein
VHFARAKEGFTLLEILIALGILAVLSGLSVPFLRQLLIRGDVQRSAEQVVQALARAQTLSQNGEGAAPWGFHVPSGTLFQGSTYETRDPQYDESYPMPPTITASGSLTELTYSQLEGKPSATGSILLLGLENERESILITISTEGIPIMFPDRLTVCHCQGHAQHTLHIPDNAWPAHQKHGDVLGPCESFPVNPCP